MSQARPSQLLMHRPHLDNLPAIPTMPEGYELRRFTPGDDEEALALTLAAAFGDDWPVERVRRELTGAPSVQATYVVNWRGIPVATTSSRYAPDHFPHSGYVHWVGTHPDHARRGLGMALVLRVLLDFKDRDYRDAVLETDDFRIPAIRTYLRCGFLPVTQPRNDDHRSRWSAVFQALLT